ETAKYTPRHKKKVLININYQSISINQFQSIQLSMTGDIGYVDQDGYLFIVDRKKDMLLCKGHNVYPRDLEEVLNAHPDVMQAAVVGKKDERYGEAPVAFVQLRPGATATEVELLTYANENMAAYKKIRRLVILAQLPASAAGKVLRRELRDQVQTSDFVV
ncbi:MAG TPA: hypothetical protein PLD71_09390, partial [Syntrophales bacterium]|nr:hypothetical protein [Syntrophales bacterium]